MNAALYFTVTDSGLVVARKAEQAIRSLGAPLKTDSGHYISGVIVSGSSNVEVRVSWLEQGGSTQITVTTTHEQMRETDLERVALRFKHVYLNGSAPRKKTVNANAFTSVLVLLTVLVVIGLFVFVMVRSK